jgi:hypothetical protein
MTFNTTKKELTNSSVSPESTSFIRLYTDLLDRSIIPRDYQVEISPHRTDDLVELFVKTSTNSLETDQLMRRLSSEV